MSNVPPPSPPRWPAVAFALIALAAIVGAFVGLGVSSLWLDELFTVHLVQGPGGFGGVIQRALTDTWPPFYYLLLYGWTLLAGHSEIALRLPSALFAVAALALFGWGARRVASSTALAFAVAVGALSPFWFMNAQNARGYALGMLLSAAMLAGALALHRRFQQGQRLPAWPLAGLFAAGLLGSFTHAYLLLAFGMMLLYLLLTLPDWRLRGLLAAVGTLVLLANVAYYRLLLQSTAQDVHHMWFRADFRFFNGQTGQALRELMPVYVPVAVLGLLLGLAFQRGLHWRRAEPAGVLAGAARWSTGLAWLVLLGVFGCGIAVSLLVAPSFSSRNLLINAPFAWLLLARLYDVAGPRAGQRLGRVLAALIVLLVGIHLVELKGRLLPRLEPWRQSAAYLRENFPQCLAQRLPVVFPFKFGPPVAVFDRMAEHDFYGHYLPQARQLLTVMPAALAGRDPHDDLHTLLAQRAAHPELCPVLAWGVHMGDESGALALAEDLARRPELAGHQIVVQEFDAYAPHRLAWIPEAGGFVFLLDGPAGNGPVRVPALPYAPASDPALGDRLVVDRLAGYRGVAGPAYLLDLYSVQEWPRRGAPSEDFLARPWLACNPSPETSTQPWPQANQPGCWRRPLPAKLLHRTLPQL